MKKLWRQHKLAVIVTTVVVLTLLGGVIALITRVAPPDPKKEPEKVFKFIASNDFNRFSTAQKREYLQQLRDSEQGENRGRGGMLRNTQLSDQERTNLMANMRPVFQAMQKEHMEKFFSLSKEKQNQELDRTIKRMDEFRARRQAQAGEQRPQTGAAAQGGNRQRETNPAARRTPSIARMKSRYENSDPITRARFMEYRKALRERRAGSR